MREQVIGSVIGHISGHYQVTQIPSRIYGNIFLSVPLPKELIFRYL